MSMRRPLLVVLVVLAAAAPASAEPPPRIGLHTMLYLDHGRAVRDAVLAEGAAAGVRLVRFDVQLDRLFAGGPTPDLRPLHAVRRSLRRYGMNGVGVLHGTPEWLTACPAWASSALRHRCTPSDPALWAAMVWATVRAAPDIRHWEVLNEANLPGTYWYGAPAEYLELLELATAAVRAGNPQARVLISGPAWPDRTWLTAVLGGRDPSALFDVANVHLRGTAASIGPRVRRTRAMYARLGFHGPLWVTELGYPSDPAQQRDPAHLGGAAAQASWLERAVPDAWDAGAEAVFVTARDTTDFGSASPFASEGVLTWPDLAPKPALATLARLGWSRPRRSRP